MICDNHQAAQLQEHHERPCAPVERTRSKLFAPGMTWRDRSVIFARHDLARQQRLLADAGRAFAADPSRSNAAWLTARRKMIAQFEARLADLGAAA